MVEKADLWPPIRNAVRKVPYSDVLGVAAAAVMVTVLMFMWLGYDFSNISRGLIGDRGDTLFNSWTIHQAMDNLLHRPLDLGYSPIFYNEPNSFIYTIAPYGIAIPLLPVYLLTGSNIVLTYNLYLLATSIFSVVFAYVLLKELPGITPWIAAFASLVMVIIPFRFAILPHIETISWQYVLLSLVCLHKLLQTEKWKWAVGLSAGFFLTLQTSGYLGMIFLTMAVIISLYYVVRKWRSITYRFVLAGLLAVGITLLLNYPLIELRLQNEVVRAGYPLSVSIELGRPIEVFLWSNALPYRAFSIAPQAGYHNLFPGVGAVVLMFLALIKRSQIDDAESQSNDRSLSSSEWIVLYGILALVGLIIAMGPVFSSRHIHVEFPLPFQLLYHLPGWSNLRVPLRFIIMTYISLGVLVAYGLQVLWQHRQQVIHRSVFFGLILLLVLDRIPYPYRTADRLESLGQFFQIPRQRLYWSETDLAPDDNAAYRWLADQPEGTAILHYPDERSIVRQYILDEVIYDQPMYNGIGSFFPDSHVEFFERGFPNEESLLLLHLRDIDYIVLHRDQHSEEALIDFDARWQQLHAGYDQVPAPYQFDDIAIYPISDTIPSPVVSSDFNFPNVFSDMHWSSSGIIDNSPGYALMTASESDIYLSPFRGEHPAQLRIELVEDAPAALIESLEVRVNGVLIETTEESVPWIRSGEVPVTAFEDPSLPVVVDFAVDPDIAGLLGFDRVTLTESPSQ